MERCKEIYNRILEEGENAIEGFLSDREVESLFLDFKRSSDDGGGRKLSKTDRRNLAKAISGFGNSEGGVIVWGIDCSPDQDGADVAHSKAYIKNPKKFVSFLQGAVSGCTVPAHGGVESHAIEVSDNKGFALTLIPKSNSSPHQTVPDMRYLIRAGSDFIPTPHDVLAGMFGRRPQPHVFHRFVLCTPEIIEGSLNITFGINVYNEGPGIASDIFCTCLMHYLPSEQSKMSTERPDECNWGGSLEFWRQTSLISAPDFRLPPGASAQPLLVHLSLVPPFTDTLKISGSVGCGGARKYDFDIECDSLMLKEQYSLFLQKTKEDSFTKGEKHAIVEAILNNSDA